jgi:hypothetical protein
MEDLLKVFESTHANFPEHMGDPLKSLLTPEISHNVFNPTKCSELCINEQDILSLHKKSDRGYSIDESPEILAEEGKEMTPSEIEFMRLKKTTVLTGNHMSVKRDRAQSDHDAIFTPQFNKHQEPKAISKFAGDLRPTQTEAETSTNPAKPNQKKYVPKSTVMQGTAYGNGSKLEWAEGDNKAS